MIKRAIVVIFLVNVACFSIAQPTPPKGYAWQPVSELTDEFDGWDSSKWWKPLWNYGVPVQMRAENSGVKNGNLWLQATLDEGSQRWFQSSRVMSYAQISYPMYTECRMRTAHISAYNTFWLNNGDSNNRDEIDICENNSKPSNTSDINRPYTMYSQYFLTVNGNDERADGNFDNRNLSPENPFRGVKWNENYHILGAYWIDKNNIQFYLDGEPAGKVTTTRDFTRDLNIIWDLWTINANWSGGIANPDDLLDSTINTMYVDWIHTYELVVPVQGLNVIPKAIETGVGQNRQLNVEIIPNNATNQMVSWTSSDTAIVTIDASTGEITGVASGNAEVTAITVDGQFSETIPVKVMADLVVVPVDSVTLEPESIEIIHGDNAFLVATIYPTDATNKNISWASTDNSIASIDTDGKVVGVSPGTTEISVTTEDVQRTAVSSITVNPILVTGVTIADNIDSIQVGESWQLTATINPDNASDKSVLWSSSNADIASVDQGGLLRGAEPGEVDISVTTNDGGFTDNVQLIIYDPVASISLDSKYSIKAFPNPTKSSLAIVGLPSEDCELEIRSVSGLLIEKISFYSDKTMIVDLSGQLPGLYLFNLSWKSGGQTLQVVRQ